MEVFYNRFGYVMFNKIPSIVKQIQLPEGRNMIDYEATSSWLYKPARLWINTTNYPSYARFLCFKAGQSNVILSSIDVLKKTNSRKEVNCNLSPREFARIIKKENNDLF